MLANNTMSQSTTNPTFIDLAALAGTGESTRFVDDVTGVLLGIEVRGGTYQVKDRRTGQLIERPNSWTSHWGVTDNDGNQREVLMSWPTYVDEAGQVMPWSRYPKSINLQQCSAAGTLLHFYKDGRNFYHLEVVEVATSQVASMPIVQAPAAPVAPASIPWARN